MFRVTIKTPDDGAAIAALRKAKVQFTVESTRRIELRATQADPTLPGKIYSMAEGGAAYGSIAARLKVSYATVLRVVHNPAQYGLDKEPIKRITWRQ